MEQIKPSNHEQKIKQAQNQAEQANKSQSYLGHFSMQTQEQHRQQAHSQDELVMEP